MQLVIRAHELKLSQREVAVLLQTSQPRISNLFNYQTEKFSLDTLYKYCNTLGIEVLIKTKLPPPPEG